MLNKPNVITENEAYIIEALRSLAPFEEMRITADKQGKVNNYLIIRSAKVVLTDSDIVYVK